MRQRRYRNLTWLTAVFVVLATFGPAAAQRGAAPAVNAVRQRVEGNSDEAIRANNIVQLRRMLGQTVKVTGKIQRASVSRSGHHFLNFESSELTAVCFQGDVAKFTDGAPAKVYADQHVELTGRLEEYRGKLQITLKSPEQIHRIDPPSSAIKLPRAKLKETGKDRWSSPAGLIYAGRDPSGLTRVEHILRHAHDIPNRAGSHGVFDADEEEVFGLIDAAWKKATAEKIRPVHEGDRSTITVPMGFPVGYLGGQAGQRRQHPSLNKIFIVFETGTKHVVTAFPK